jgi:hypothetical protein
MHQRTGVARPAQATLTRSRATARENRDFVSGLLARKQPEFARALAAVERELERQVRHCPPERLACRLCSRALIRP